MIKKLIALFLCTYSHAVAGGVINGQPVNATVTNAAFLFKNANDQMPFRLDFTSGTGSFGSSVINIQRNINAAYSYMGGATNQAFNYLPTWPTNNRGSSSDSIFLRSVAFDSAFDGTTGHTHDGTAGNGPKIFGADLDSTGSSAGTVLMADGSGGSSFSAVVNTVHADANPGINGAVKIASGTNVTLGQSGNTITINASAGSPAAPTIQKFLTGSGTYTRPSGPAPTYIKVTVIGGGGGGGGAGSGTSGGNGGTGGNSTFGPGLLVANGGTGGTPGTNLSGVAGGSASLGAAIGIALTGGSSQGGNQALGGGGGNGGSTIFGGAGGGGGIAFAGSAGIVNTGSGGGGGGAGATGGNAGPGGGSGGAVMAIITSPAASYAYVVGAGGSAGAAGSGTGVQAGGAGGDGVVIVEEYY